MRTKSRIGKARQAFNTLRPVWYSTGIWQKEQPHTESAGAVQCLAFVSRGTIWANYMYFALTGKQCVNKKH